MPGGPGWKKKFIFSGETGLRLHSIFGRFLNLTPLLKYLINPATEAL